VLGTEADVDGTISCGGAVIFAAAELDPCPTPSDSAYLINQCIC